MRNLLISCFCLQMTKRDTLLSEPNEVTFNCLGLLAKKIFFYNYPSVSVPFAIISGIIKYFYVKIIINQEKMINIQFFSTALLFLLTIIVINTFQTYKDLFFGIIYTLI